MRPNSVVNWFIALFKAVAAEGCSSHSGRRTFITLAARQAHKAGRACGTFSYWPGTDRFKPRRPTSMATATRSGGWSAAFCSSGTFHEQ